ncbi:unnamed protein product [Gongylonema pulchrum]|uniref:Transmembrane protein n=1 Tax=Gongylonema pulchrum TaxID=637853 RepID=A0A183D1V8_9BILA|nr:unnamed protein product [Gongylonema pulchrum]
MMGSPTAYMIVKRHTKNPSRCFAVFVSPSSLLLSFTYLYPFASLYPWLQHSSIKAELAMTFIICSATFCLTGSLPAAALAGLVHYAFGRVKPYVPPYKR